MRLDTHLEIPARSFKEVTTLIEPKSIKSSEYRERVKPGIESSNTEKQVNEPPVD